MKRGKINFPPSVALSFYQEKSFLEVPYPPADFPLNLTEYKWHPSTSNSVTARGFHCHLLVENNNESSSLDFWQERRENDLG